MKEVHHSFKQSHFTAHLLLISSPMNMVLWIVFGIGGWSWRLLKICIWYFWLLYIAKHFQVILSQRWILTNDLHHSNLSQINAVFDVARKKIAPPPAPWHQGQGPTLLENWYRSLLSRPPVAGQTACDMGKVSESDRGASYVSPSPESARRLRTRSSVLNIYFSSRVMSLAKCKLSEYVSVGNGFDWSALIKNKSTGKSDRSRTLNSTVVLFFLRIPTSRMQ